ncbi:MAG TPA: tRNA-intron lyase [Thermoproteales archaeon]|nr:tRNA-intron lyase [Thermoproteales archaeon]
MKAIATLIGRRIVILDPEEGGKIYSEGFYGKFYAMPKPKVPEISRELELSYFDALYLLEKGKIKIVTEENKEVSIKELEDLAVKEYENFKEAYLVYRDLRNKGFIVKSGMKFGTTFAVYKFGPGIDHAPFLVNVTRYSKKLDPIEIVRAGRLSHSVRKKLVTAYVNPKTGETHYFIFKWRF